MQKNIKVTFFSNEHKGKVPIYLISSCMSSRGDSAVLDYGRNGITSVLFPVTHTSLVSLNNHASQAVSESLLICFLQSRPLFGSHGDQKWQLLQTATTVPQLRVPTKRSLPGYSSLEFCSTWSSLPIAAFWTLQVNWLCGEHAGGGCFVEYFCFAMYLEKRLRK